MKWLRKPKYLLLIALLSFCYSSYGQTVYLDQNNNQISKKEFERIRKSNQYLDIPGDSINSKKLISREKTGRINDRAKFEQFLAAKLNLDQLSGKPIVVIYYPGKDRCNSSGASSKSWIKNWYGQLEKGISNIAPIEPIYVYKDKDGLEKYEGVVKWNKDPDGIIERLFFEYHYPCKSFVVISKTGEYISYFGEFGKEEVWEATLTMK